MVSEVCAMARSMSMAVAETSVTHRPGNSEAMAAAATSQLAEDIDAVGCIDDMSWDQLKQLMLLQTRRMVKDLES